MAKTTVTNVSSGPRGLYNSEGQLVMLERGESVEIEITDAERKDAKATEYFEFGEAAAKRAAKAEGEEPAAE